MADRNLSTKQRAQRIDWTYHRRQSIIPLWKGRLSWILVALSLSWVAWHALAHDSSIYATGPVTKAHGAFAARCTDCHSQTAGIGKTAIGKTAVDARCLNCHDGPAHSPRMASTPQCQECHVEHEGIEKLIPASDRVCTGCHANLHTKDGPPKVAASVSSWTGGHPEFSVKSAGAKDPGQIKFSHKTHLGQALPEAAERTQLRCTDCHKAEVGTVSVANVADAPRSPRPWRADMAPVTYEGQCASCHALEYSSRINDCVPHATPEKIHAYLLAKFTAYIAAHPTELTASPDSGPRIPRVMQAREPANPRQWAELRVAESEHLLWTKTCVECHTLTPGVGNSDLPAVVPANLKSRWLARGEFNHEPHGFVDCTQCHAAQASDKASDILIPGAAVCRDCHTQSRSAAISARSNCTECHSYHDWSKQKNGNAGHAISGL